MLPRLVWALLWAAMPGLASAASVDEIEQEGKSNFKDSHSV